MAFKMNRWSAFTKPTETNPDGTERSNPKNNPKMTKSEGQSPVWSDKLTRLDEKRTKKRGEGKSTKRVQKRINKELQKLKSKVTDTTKSEQNTQSALPKNKYKK